MQLRIRRAARRSGRIADKDLVDALVWTAVEAAVPQRLPLQFHVALGDDDIVMTQNDPTLMRALLAHRPFRYCRSCCCTTVVSGRRRISPRFTRMCMWTWG
ncbi:MAG: hypothetical protein U0841_17260 [Chloroflexia bacterium]